MKKLVTILLLLIITVQILPVTQLGKCMFDKECVEDDECKEVEKEKKFETEATYLLVFSKAINAGKKSQNHFPISATGIQPHPISDVTTPPPNVA